MFWSRLSADWWITEGPLQAAELIRTFEGDFVDNPGEVGNRCLHPILSVWVESKADHLQPCSFGLNFDLIIPS